MALVFSQGKNSMISSTMESVYDHLTTSRNPSYQPVTASANATPQYGYNSNISHGWQYSSEYKRDVYTSRLNTRHWAGYTTNMNSITTETRHSWRVKHVQTFTWSYKHTYVDFKYKQNLHFALLLFFQLGKTTKDKPGKIWEYKGKNRREYWFLIIWRKYKQFYWDLHLTKTTKWKHNWEPEPKNYQCRIHYVDQPKDTHINSPLYLGNYSKPVIPPLSVASHSKGNLICLWRDHLL